MRKPRLVNLQHEVSVWEVGLAKLQGEVSARKVAIVNLQDQVSVWKIAFVNLQDQVSARKVAIADLQGEVSVWKGGPAKMILIFSLSLDVNYHQCGTTA